MIKLEKIKSYKMTKEDILSLLSQNKSYIQKNYEVEKIGIFGSYARDKQTDNSDIDFYVEFKNKTFSNLSGLWTYLENLYHKKIDIIHKHKNNNRVIISNIQKTVLTNSGSIVSTISNNYGLFLFLTIW